MHRLGSGLTWARRTPEHQEWRWIWNATATAQLRAYLRYASERKVDLQGQARRVVPPDICYVRGRGFRRLQCQSAFSDSAQTLYC